MDKSISLCFRRRVFILGPSHHVRLAGCALSSVDRYQTPLYDLTIDTNGKYSRTFLKDHPIGHENVVCQNRWSLVTGSVILKWRSFRRKCVVCQERSLMVVVSRERFHCTVSDCMPHLLGRELKVMARLRFQDSLNLKSL